MDDPQLLRTALMVTVAAFLAAGGALIYVLIWFAIRIIAQVESNAVAQNEQFRQFGQQMAGIKELIKDELHKMELRVYSLEQWRRSSNKGASDD